MTKIIIHIVKSVRPSIYPQFTKINPPVYLSDQSIFATSKIALLKTMSVNF